MIRSRLRPFLQHWAAQALERISRWGWTTPAALMVSLLAAYLAYDFIGSQIDKAKADSLPPGGMVTVLVAARPIRTGERLSLENLAARDLPKLWLSDNTLMADDLDAVMGKAALRPLSSGAPIAQSDLLMTEVGSLEQQVRPGHRVFHLSTQSQFLNLLKPNDRIDLWDVGGVTSTGLTDQIEVVQTHSGPEGQAKLLLSAVRVLSVGRPSPNEEGAPAPGAPVLIEVPEQQIATLLSAQAKGRVSFVLRGKPSVSGQEPPIRAKRPPTAADQGPIEILVNRPEGV